MSRFLSVISVSETSDIVRSLVRTLPAESIALDKAVRRITGEDIASDIDIPGFDRSTVDGYAVRASDTTGAGEAIPAILTLSGRIKMGEISPDYVNPGSCMYIPTGAPLPEGADAVVMVEYCEDLGDEVLVHRPVARGENLIRKGEDFTRDRIIVPRGTRITSRVMGVLAACGAASVKVVKQPRIGIISTGNELVPVDSIPDSGKIRDVNTYLCAGFAREYGCIPEIFGIIPDDPRSLSETLDKALTSCDCLLISGGSSKGERDISADIIGSKGEVLVHGIAISPGKPTIIGRCNDLPVIGLPGHPASAYITLLVVVGDLLRRMQGVTEDKSRIYARLKSPVSSAKGREDYVRGILDGEYIIPVPGRSGLTNTLLHSDGVIRIPADLEGYESGELVEVILWRM